MGKKRVNSKKLVAIGLSLIVILGTFFGCISSTASAAGPEDDYFQAINGTMLESKELDPDSGEWSATSELTDETEAKLDEIIEKLAENRDSYKEGTMERQVADYYLSALDKEGREKAGLDAVKPILNKIQEASSINQLANVWAELAPHAYSLPLYISYDANPSDSNQPLYDLLGNSTDYSEDFLSDNYNREATQKYIKSILSIYGEGEKAAKSYSNKITEFLYDTAKHSTEDDEDNKNTDTEKPEYNIYTKEQMQSLFSNINIDDFISAADKGIEKYMVIGHNQFLVDDPEYIKYLDKKYLNDENLELLKRVTVFLLIDGWVGQYHCMPMAYESAYISYNNMLDETSEEYNNKQVALDSTKAVMSNALGKLYVKKYFPKELKEEAGKLIQDIIAEYKQRINEQTWMSEQTKAEALKKLEKMNIKVGYPDGEWKSGLETCRLKGLDEGGNLLANFMEFMENGNVPDKPATTVDKESWGMSVTEVNAMYMPTENSITIPAGILQRPFYDPKADLATNLGGIGATIAHEITHAFDDQGALYNADGNYENWWTDEDYKAFEDLQTKVIKYFGKMTVDSGDKVDGELTLGENIADIGAMECVVDMVGDTEKEQKKFFESYAKSWASKYDEDVQKELLESDEHAPDKVRVNGILSSTDEFYDLYDVNKGDGMYIAPKERVSMW